MGDSSGHLERLHTDEMELGTTEAIRNHYERKVVSPVPISQRRLNFEHSRPRFLRECIAEATGTFFYVFPGVATIAAMTTKDFSPTFGNILTIGLAFGFGIVFAIITCAPVSGGHFNPAISVAFATFQGFPWRKVPHYVISQIIGSFIAGLLVMGMYHQQIEVLVAETIKAGKPLITSGSPASILVSLPADNQTLGYLFLVEWFVDSFIAVIIWACLDPANPFIAPSSVPFVIGLGYAVTTWGFGGLTITQNMARGLGCRLVAAIFYGPGDFTYKYYSWIAILVNVPATVFGGAYYELVMRDSLQTLGAGAARYEGEEEDLALHLSKTGISMQREREECYAGTRKRSSNSTADGKLQVPPV
ncbi:aquaporin [Lecanosticta acicola]|uniref:Aquaporin n=1 Tax=Lecanosticta acicola TaxID=111012 RepID=A0AAI9ECX8_9PEZI|nr:aquaporin [Lecanosticta acicola]